MKKQSVFKTFNKNFWTVITMEFFERGAYYGVLSILSVYMVKDINDGGLGFSREGVGVIKSITTPLLYLLPILSGAIADRYGYRKTLLFSFVVMSLGYFLTAFATSYEAVFGAWLLMVIGAGFFKPIISGTIARETNSETSGLGFGVFYWSINLGAFIFPLILVPYLKQYSYSYIFIMASFVTAMMIFLNLFVYKEPKKPSSNKSLGESLKGILLVITDVRFITMIAIYSCFWILYFQMFDTVLWYLTEEVDMTPVNNSINAMLGLFISSPNWKFDAEHVTVINAGTIIALQLLISSIVRKRKALPTMIVGIAMGTVGMAVLAISDNAWVFLIGIIIFSIGEMTAHPKFISYVGLTAPEDKKALYLGYSFLYGVIGSGVGGLLGAYSYVYFIDERDNAPMLWLMFAGIGIITILGLLLYNRFMVNKKEE